MGTVEKIHDMVLIDPRLGEDFEDIGLLPGSVVSILSDDWA